MINMAIRTVIYLLFTIGALLTVSCSNNVNLVSSAKNTNSPKYMNPNRKLLFVSNQDGDREIFITNLKGENLTQLTQNSSDDYDASWSPNGQHILFTSNRDNGNSEVYIMRTDGSQQVNLSKSAGYDGQARWSPDGNSIAFTSDRDGAIGLFIMTPMTGNDIRKLSFEHSKNVGFSQPVWSPNGKWIAYRKQNERAKADLWLVDVDKNKHRQLTNNDKFDDDLPNWSPDSNKLIYQSRRNREYNIYLYNINSNKESKLTNLPSADARPRWSNQGNEIVFLSTRGPSGRTQVFIMNEDGSRQHGITDNRFQVNDAEWLDENRLIYVSWERGNVSNVFLTNIKSGVHYAVSPANGYQSQPLLEPVVFSK